jgi:acyl-coenzyme A thioesterase PaaI-like protein
MAFIGVLKRTQRYLSFEEVTKRFTQTGTIDLRVDYLNPGKGKYFLSEASILRLGNKIAVVRTDLKNDQSVLIASGTGTYLIG